MPSSMIALYAGKPLGPGAISQNLIATQKAGWNTIILSLFHIGYPTEEHPEWHPGDIFFNDTLIISEGKYVADLTWPGMVAKIKQTGGSIKSIYASIGGGDPVVDFDTIKKIYDQKHTFSGTMLEQNLRLLHKTFPSIEGIDMDCEETFDKESFVAFCEMVIGMSFSITFCPAFKSEIDFWVNSLFEIEQKHSGAVKWWNLQCYSGGSENDPQQWADKIKAKMPTTFSTNGYLVIGDGTRWYYEQFQAWYGHCPDQVTPWIARFSKKPYFGGGFIWNMEQILVFGPRTDGCGSVETMVDYANAVKKAF